MGKGENIGYQHSFPRSKQYSQNSSFMGWKELIGTEITLHKVISGVQHGSEVKCLTRNPGALGSSRTGSPVFFVVVSLVKALKSPSLVLVKPRKDLNNVNCRRDMTEILLKAENTIY